MKHILICGEIGVGKSTLVNRLLEDCHVPVYGFITKKMRESADGLQELYMFRASDTERKLTADNHLANCGGPGKWVNLPVFDGTGAEYIHEAKHGGIIIMDELGFLETGAKHFCSVVLGALDGDIPVIATVKSTHKEVDFLNKVRNHPRADLYIIDRDNRDDLFLELKPKAGEMFRFAEQA